jgi:hypothetical protein
MKSLLRDSVLFLIAATVLFAAGCSGEKHPAEKPVDETGREAAAEPAPQKKTESPPANDEKELQAQSDKPVEAQAQPHQIANLDKLLEVLEEGGDLFTEEQVRAIAGKMIGLVEEAVGRKFKKPPVVKAAGRDVVSEALARDLLPQLKRLYPGLGEDRIALVSRLQAKAFVVCLLGKYAFEDSIVYVMPGNIEPILKLTGVDMKHAESILKVIVAHELTHALQFEDEKVVETFSKIDNIERAQAFNAVMEGEAVYIQDVVGKKLGLDEALMEMTRIVSAGAYEFEDPALDVFNRMLSAHFEQIYIGGRKFVEYHVKKGGRDAFWKILIHPPASTSMIANPQTYSPTAAAAKVNYARLLEGLEDDFGERNWNVQNLEVGHMMLQAVYAGMDAQKRKKFISNVEHVQSLIAQVYGEAVMANISIFKLKDAALTAEMKDALVELVKANVKKIEGSAMVKLKDFRVGPFDGVKADVTSKICFTVKPPGEKGIRQAFYRVFRGDVMVEIFDSDIGLSDEKIAALVEKVFKRYNKALKGGAKEEDYCRLAIKKALAVCTEVRKLFKDDPPEEPQGNENYDIIRRACLESLDEWSTKACREAYAGEEVIERRKLLVHVLRRDLERGYACLFAGRLYDLDKFTELCRKEGIRSGREHQPSYPRKVFYKLCVIVQPGHGITARDIAPLIVAVMKNYSYRVAVLPPFTEEAEKLFLHPPENKDESKSSETPEKKGSR